MTITRKIQIYVNEDDAEQRKQFVHTWYEWRDICRKAANLVTAHKFTQQQIRDFVYVKDEMKEKFYVKDIINEGKGMSEENVTYRLLSNLYKGTVPMNMLASLNREVCSVTKKSMTDIHRGTASLRSYKNNIGMPVSSKTLKTIKVNDDGKYIVTIYGIPMAFAFGRDRSNNQSIVDRCMSGEYKFCDSKVMIDDGKKKMFLLMVVDIPKTEYTPIKDKTLFARLSPLHPIVYVVDVTAKTDFDSGRKVFEIGTAEEFFYRRRQIQDAVRRMQASMRYNTGGKGRKKKCKALDRYHKLEEHYIRTRMHQYSAMLVKAAAEHKAERIVLMDQKRREEEAESEPLVLRNWSYSGLKEFIDYKAKKYGITVETE